MSSRRRKRSEVFLGLAKNREGLTFAEWYWAAWGGMRHPDYATPAAHEAWRNGTHPSTWCARRGSA